MIQLNAGQSKQLVVVVVASTRYTAMDLRGTASRYAKCGLVPMVAPSAGDLLCILQDLLRRAGPPDAEIPDINEYGKMLLCELCCGNYRIFEEALLAICNVTDNDKNVVNLGKPCLSEQCR